MKHLAIAFALSIFLVACGEEKTSIEPATQTITISEPEVTIAAEPLADSTAAISGTITYGGQVVLPEDTKLDIRLVDISERESGNAVVSMQSTVLDGMPPYPFELDYDKALVDDAGVYVVRAVVRMDKEVLFRGSARLRSFSDDDVSAVSLELIEVGED